MLYDIEMLHSKFYNIGVKCKQKFDILPTIFFCLITGSSSASAGRMDAYSYEEVLAYLLGNSYEEITSRKLQYTQDSFSGYISNLYNLSLDNAEKFWELMFGWNPKIFLPHFGHRIPNKEEEHKVW